MLTADQIAEKTGLGIHIVRYRLTELRRTGKVRGERFGQTYAYSPTVIAKVKKFDKKKG